MKRGGGSGGAKPKAKDLDRQKTMTSTLKERDPDEDTMKDWPKEYGNTGVQESDGNFFESFTALAWKQENRRRRVASEDEAEAKKAPPSETKLGPKPANIFRPNRKEYEQLYIEVLYTVKHKIGQTTGHHLPIVQDLYHYAREAFGINAEDHARLLSKASEEKPPILVLECTVLEARDLEAKDADGFSDPYCMLGILPGDRPEVRGHYDSLGSQGSYSSDDESQGGKPRRESSLKKFTQSFKRKPRKETARDMVPARYIRTTTVKPNTLNPIWNEKFKFDLENVHTDRLHMDIWDHDDEFSVVDAAKQLNQVQGFKGLGRYFKQIAQSARTNKKGNVDDFLGSVNIRLNDIPSIGVEEWYDLEGRSSRSNVEGQIHLRLRLATREDRGYSEEDNWDEIKEHEDMMCVVIEHEMKKFKGENYQWTGELCQAANTILHQHAIQGDITDVQQSVCRWSAYSRKHREHPFDWSLLLRLLEDLDEKWEPASLSKDEEENLAESFNHFITYCLELMKRQRVVYPPANKAAHVRLLFMLRCLAKIYDMPVFQRCCPFQKPLHAEIVYALRKSNGEWYDHIRNCNWPSSDSDEDAIQSMISLTNTLNTDMQKALQYYTPIYEKYVSVHYFSVVYKHLEKMLGDDINKDLERVSFIIPDTTEDDDDEEQTTAQMMGTQLFELYLALHEFCKFAKHVAHGEQRATSITTYYEFYRVPVQRWLNMSKYKAMRRIKKAVDLDKELQIAKVGQVEGTVKQSTSAVDVACCFGQVIEFWKSMEWPDNAGAMVFISKITEDLCQGAIYYADLIHEKLKGAGYYDEIGQFDVTEQLCRTINDIEQVRRSLKPIPDALRFDGVILALERSQGNKVSDKARWSLYGILHNADDNMVRKIKQVVDRVADKMRPDIKKFVFHLCWSAEKVPAADAISELMHYLDSNLLTLNNNLLRTNFDRILDSIWVEVLEEIADVLEKEEVKAFWFFSRLYDALAILVDFFNANDKGLNMGKISNPQYQSLRRKLALNKSHTNHLIETFYIDKLEEQEKYEGSQFGTISVRVYYNDDAEILSVEVLNARNVIPLDPNGLSDPFVLIELAPKHCFSHMNVQQTQIIKRNLNPTFDESFEFSISAADCRQNGACVHFTVMDHDLLLTNDFAGEAFLSLNTIPGISGELISGFSALTPLNIPLTQPKRGTYCRSKDPLNALRIRDDDRDAQEFVKKRRNIEAQSQA